jgi:hypothetical protein
LTTKKKMKYFPLQVRVDPHAADRRRNSGKGVVHTIRGVRGKNPRNELISLGRREWQVSCPILPSSITRERQKSARSRR